MIQTGYTQEQLNKFLQIPIKSTFVKIELLNWKEEFIREIQGLVTQGSISIDGKSSMRRTCNLTLTIPDNINEIELQTLINLNKKFKLYVGCQYQNEIMWFKQGIFVFISANFSHSTSGTTVSITARDKMCLLNGQVQGVIPVSTIFHNKTENDELVLTPVNQIVYECVNHWGKEPGSNIFINNIPDYGRLLIKYIGTTPLYLLKNNNSDELNGNYSIGEPANNTNYEIINYGDLAGYKRTPFTYPGELISNVGEAVTSVLDKVCNAFGNFEYFYDIDGKFIFQEKQNYLNTSYVPLQELQINDYLSTSINSSFVAYDFTDSNIITSYSNAPKWENIKNDFVVWGNRVTADGKETPIHYHLALDKRVKSDENIDYRQLELGDTTSDYYLDLSTFWSSPNGDDDSKIYYKKDGEWQFNPIVTENPEALDYWLEIIEPTGEYEKFSVENIGRRTYAVHDDKVTCIYSPEPPKIVFYDELETNETTQDLETSETFNGYKAVRVSDELDSALVAAADNKSCFDVIRQALYQKLSLQETITIQCLPIYWLEPNDIISVKDTRSQIYGNYIISSISLPLTYNGLMSITAIRLDLRI